MTASFLRGSSNYVWLTTDVLGKGATGAVYKGVNKKTGEPVAVKTFNEVSHMRRPEVKGREFDVIRRVNHRNIVKLLAIEEEQDSRGKVDKVIVMELCTGGSLYSILEEPENTYGLLEKEFILVLDHLTAGMKHLRDNNLVHRDLKPGNIMKFITDDGSIIYKLTDFGAARELKEDEAFFSLYGTEEYLHPGIYEKAVLHDPAIKAFGASVDLWSIGVTLYHVATGNLPFRPYGGRQNKRTMFQIITQKKSGVISGTQLEENGPITWSNELPDTCHLSRGLKDLVTPLLAGLMETDSKRVWSFDNFFEKVTGILLRKVVHIYYLNHAQSIRVYLHPEGKYDELQSRVLFQTDVAPSNQILLLKDQPLLALIDEYTTGRGYPVTDETSPIMLLNRDDNNVTPVSECDLPDFPAFPNSVIVDKDAGVAKGVCSTGHEYKRRIEKLSNTSRLNHLCVEVMSAAVCKDIDRVLAKSGRLQDLARYAEEVVAAISRSQKSLQELYNSPKSKSLASASEDMKSLSESCIETTRAVRQLHRKCVMDRELDAAARELVCPAKLRLPNRAKTLVNHLRDSWQLLLRDRATRNLTYNDEQFHVLEKIKVGNTSRQLRDLLVKETLPLLAQQAETMADWYKTAQTVFLKTEILERDVSEYENTLDKLLRGITAIDCNFHEELLMQVLSKKFSGDSRKQESSQRRPVSQEDAKQFRENLKQVLVVQKTIRSEVQENSNLLNKLQEVIKVFPSNFANDVQIGQ